MHKSSYQVNLPFLCLGVKMTKENVMSAVQSGSLKCYK